VHAERHEAARHLGLVREGSRRIEWLRSQGYAKSPVYVSWSVDRSSSGSCAKFTAGGMVRAARRLGPPLREEPLLQCRAVFQSGKPRSFMHCST
jgi:hypothetical protein